MEFRHKEWFACSAQRIFDVMTDLDRAGQWMPGFVRVEKGQGGPIGLGSRWTETRRIFGKEASEAFEVTAYEPARKLELLAGATEHAMRSEHFRFQYNLLPRDEGTLVSVTTKVTGLTGWNKWLGRVFRSSLRGSIVSDLAALKKYCETPA